MTQQPIHKPWWQNRTTLIVALGVAAMVPEYVPQILPYVPVSWAHRLQGIAVFCALVTSISARVGGERAGKGGE